MISENGDCCLGLGHQPALKLPAGDPGRLTNGWLGQLIIHNKNSDRHLWFHLSSSWPGRDLFVEIWQKLKRLPSVSQLK
jgi:hypothetical protein